MLSPGSHHISSRLSLKWAHLKILSNIDQDSVRKQTLKLPNFSVMGRLQYESARFGSPHGAESRKIQKTPKSRQKLLRSSANQGTGNVSGEGHLVIWQRRVQINPQPNTPPCAQGFHETVQQLRSDRKPRSDGHFTSAAGTLLSIEVVQATKRGFTRDKPGQQVSFESHERGEYGVGPLFVHVPHLRAIDEKFLFRIQRHC